MTENQLTRRLLKPALLVAALMPSVILMYLTWGAYRGTASTWPSVTGTFGANPLEDLTHRTGDWALRFLCVTLTITPLRRMTGWNGAIRFRRMFGLLAFFYAVLHVLTYAFLDRFASLEFTGDGMASWAAARALGAWIVDDIYKRPFITIGFAAFVSMLPLALTSTAGMIRRLGGRRWQLLHRLVYFSAIAAVIHFWWLVKSDIREPAIYGAVVAILLALRVYLAARNREDTKARRNTTNAQGTEAGSLI